MTVPTESDPIVNVESEIWCRMPGYNVMCLELHATTAAITAPIIITLEHL